MKVEMAPGLPNSPTPIGEVKRLTGRKEDLRQKKKKFVGWRKEELNGKVAKLPLSLIDGKANDWNQLERWITFSEAKTMNEPLGFVLVEEDRIICIDLDNAIQEGKLTPMAKEVVGSFAGTYMEVSQSGRGIHIFAYGIIPNT